MKLIRAIQKKQTSGFFLPALAILFVFALSFHNHALVGSNALALDSNTTSGHSIEDCSACLLQGNLQVPETGHPFNIYNLGQIIGVITAEYIVPNTFINSDKSSRAPPTA